MPAHINKDAIRKILASAFSSMDYPWTLRDDGVVIFVDDSDEEFLELPAISPNGSVIRIRLEGDTTDV